MSDMCMGSEKGKLSLKSELLLGGLALAVFIGLGTAAYAASPKNPDKLLSSRMNTFDPFTLQKSLSWAENVSGDVGNQGQIIILGQFINNTPPPICIPCRPTCRSPFRPPLVLR